MGCRSVAGTAQHRFVRQELLSWVSGSAVRRCDREAWRRGETRRRWRRRHARADGFGLGGAATAWAAAALSARACRLLSLCAARAQSGAGKRGGAGKRAAAAAAAARAGGLIRTGRSDRLGGRRRSRRKLSIYVQKPLGRVCCAVCSRKTNGCLGTS